MERILPIAKKYSAAIIGMCNDERVISQDPFVRLDVARKIASGAADYRIRLSDVLFDPLVLTVGADFSAAKITLHTTYLLRQEIGANMIAGASNVSFGQPDRPSLDAAFVTMAMARGLTAAVANPLEPAVRTAILAADLLLGHDQYCRKWIKDYRQREKVKTERQL